MGFILVLVGIIVFILLCSIRQVAEYERGLLFQLGKYKKILNPGWNIVLPIFQSYQKVDIRTKAVDVPEQDAITKDNVTIRINAVIYYKVFDAGKAIIAVENFQYAVSLWNYIQEHINDMSSVSSRDNRSYNDSGTLKNYFVYH